VLGDKAAVAIDDYRHRQLVHAAELGAGAELGT
jgi:hypothetical protein